MTIAPGGTSRLIARYCLIIGVNSVAIVSSLSKG